MQKLPWGDVKPSQILGLLGGVASLRQDGKPLQNLVHGFAGFVLRTLFEGLLQLPLGLVELHTTAGCLRYSPQ